ncbi:MAG: sulfatase-like hydrolase/transferase [Pseudomonadota bacterium]
MFAGYFRAKRLYHRFARGFNLEFAGTDSFLNSHSYSRSIGLMAHENYTDRPQNLWGSYDDDIYRFAIDEIDQLARGDAPYYLTLTTNGGHFPNSHVSPFCRNSKDVERSPIDIVNAIACTNHLTEKFVRELDQRGLLENTIVVIQSDHLLMRSPLTPMLDKHERANFFSIVGDGIEPAISNKESSMMDVYPTILEFVGYEVVDRKAGLGVSLLSEHPSLLEQFGQVTVDHSLVANKELSVAIWAAGEQ